MSISITGVHRRLIRSCGRLLPLAAGTMLVIGLATGAASAATQTFAAHGVPVSVEFGSTPFTAGDAAIMEWVHRSADIVSAYYGRFPAANLRIQLVAGDGDGVETGRTWDYRGGFIRINVGREVTAAQLLNDWVLVHEMTHLALPDVGDEHQWLSEGLAVYVEGIERVQAGNRTAEDVFAEQLRSMPRGLPQSGDEGLDHTHTWARTYWGGALFCFLADVQIHQRTDNRFGLQDGLRAVLQASGGMSADWNINRVFAVADAATGTHVLEELYAQMKDRPVTPDLQQLWQELGVQREGSQIRLREDAPLAAVRRSIMQGPAKKTSS
jgi:hypothetical protein